MMGAPGSDQGWRGMNPMKERERGRDEEREKIAQRSLLFRRPTLQKTPIGYHTNHQRSYRMCACTMCVVSFPPESHGEDAGAMRRRTLRAHTSPLKHSSLGLVQCASSFCTEGGPTYPSKHTPTAGDLHARTLVFFHGCAQRGLQRCCLCGNERSTSGVFENFPLARVARTERKEKKKKRGGEERETRHRETETHRYNFLFYFAFLSRYFSTLGTFAIRRLSAKPPSLPPLLSHSSLPLPLSPSLPLGLSMWPLLLLFLCPSRFAYGNRRLSPLFSLLPP